jgi:hypothetical protein
MSKLESLGRLQGIGHAPRFTLEEAAVLEGEPAMENIGRDQARLSGCLGCICCRDLFRGMCRKTGPQPDAWKRFYSALGE